MKITLMTIMMLGGLTVGIYEGCVKNDDDDDEVRSRTEELEDGTVRIISEKPVTLDNGQQATEVTTTDIHPDGTTTSSGFIFVSSGVTGSDPGNWFLDPDNLPPLVGQDTGTNSPP